MPPPVDDVVADVARAVDAEVAELTHQMTDWFVDVIPLSYSGSDHGRVGTGGRDEPKSPRRARI